MAHAGLAPPLARTDDVTMHAPPRRPAPPPRGRALLTVALIAVAALVAQLSGGRQDQPSVAAAPQAGLTDGPAAVTRSFAGAAQPEVAAARDTEEPAPPRPADLDQVLAAVEAAAPRFGVQLVAVSVEDLRRGDRWQVNGDRQMSFMSSSKFPWVVMAVAAAGAAAAEAAAVATFTWSDNDAASELIDLAGGLDAVNDLWNPQLGMATTCHQQWFGAWYAGQCRPDLSPPFDVPGYEFLNYSTADDLTRFLARLWRGEVPGLDGPGREAVLAWSLLSPDDLDLGGDGTLTGYLPPALRSQVHHKVGWDFVGYLSASDIGIVDAPRATYAVAVAAFGGADSAAQQHFLAWTSCELYRSLSGDRWWGCPQDVPGGEGAVEPAGPIDQASAGAEPQPASAGEGAVASAAVAGVDLAPPGAVAFADVALVAPGAVDLALGGALAPRGAALASAGAALTAEAST